MLGAAARGETTSELEDYRMQTTSEASQRVTPRSEWPIGEMVALVMTEPGVVRPETRPIPEEAPGTVLVRVAYLGVCGSDLELLDGSSFYIQQGMNHYPLVFGHEYSGVVEAVGAGVSEFEPGDRVVGITIVSCGTCRWCMRGKRRLCENFAEVGLWGHEGAASEYFRVPVRGLAKVGPSLGLREAALVEPSSTAVHAAERTDVGIYDRVAVIGTGMLGLVAVQIAKAVGAEVHAIGVEEGGLALAAEVGADCSLRPEEAEERAYSVVVEASGAVAAFESVPRLLERGGRAALVGVVNESTLSFVPSFVNLNDQDLLGIFSGSDHYDQTLNLFASGKVSPEVLIERVIPAADVAEAFEAMVAGERARPKILMEFAGG